MYHKYPSSWVPLQHDISDTDLFLSSVNGPPLRVLVLILEPRIIETDQLPKMVDTVQNNNHIYDNTPLQVTFKLSSNEI
jgi:hypothetical protein